LKIARAYGRLSSIPGNGPEASVSLASIGSYEIRMLGGSAIDLDSPPLFWLELFNHRTKTSVDSFCGHTLKDAVDVFRDYVAQADDLNKTGGCS